MGYYTDYKLEYKGDLDQETLITKLEEVSGYRWWDNYLTLPDVKWYEHDHHMEVISREYPDILFILTGEGEESGDVWRKYFKNGLSKYDRAELSFPEFDESQLG
jgi:hypothetical protein